MYNISIDQFEGPFDLLVYLIENSQMSIYDIRISEITSKYLDYLEEMENLDVNISSEFIFLAAVLIKLKSAMLLPRTETDEENEIAEDPRKELQTKLSEYIRIKKIAKMFKEREEENFSRHEKPAEDISEYTDAPFEILKISIDEFIKAFKNFISRKERTLEIKKKYKQIRRERVSLEDRIGTIWNFLENNISIGEGVDFFELLPEEKKTDREETTLAFLSILELVKAQRVDVKQKENYGNIHITRKGNKNVQ